MILIISLFLISLSIQSIESFICPKDSFQIPSEDICVYSIAESDFYLDGVRECIKYGVFDGKAPYIGVEKKPNGTWAYPDGTALVYQNWAPNEPNNENSSICAILDPKSTQWIAVDCSTPRPYFCGINGDDFQCPKYWEYFPDQEYCYYVQDFTYPDGVQWQLYDQKAAEANCLRWGGHLASIHNETEEQFIYNLITSNVLNMTQAANNTPCDYQYAFIGLYGTGALGDGQWTDATPVDFIGYKENPQPDRHPWMLANDDSCHRRGWFFGDDKFARFVCRMSSKNRVIREKLEMIEGNTSKTLWKGVL